jgi:hypothetical protein
MLNSHLKTVAVITSRRAVLSFPKGEGLENIRLAALGFG